MVLSKSKKRRNRRKRHIRDILSFLDGCIHEKPATKEELLEMIRCQDLDHNMTSFDGEWTKKRVLEVIADFNDQEFNQLKGRLMHDVRKKRTAERLENQLFEQLQSRFPNEDIDVREFVRFARNCYGIKIYFGGQGYLFDFDGSIDELVNSLSLEMKDHLSDVVECPHCCDVEMPRHHWYERTFCDCGAQMFKETSKQTKTDSRGRDRMVGQLEEKFRGDKAYRFAGKNSSGYGMWFGNPDENMVLDGSLDERKERFACYLRYRQKVAGYVDPEITAALSTKDLLESYRICSNCQEELYTEMDQNSALMECTSMDSAFDFMSELGRRHSH